MTPLRDAADAPTLPGMPVPLVAATPTRLSGWESCPRRYRFTYLERPTPRRGAPWAHTAVGAAVHTALARWWRTDRVARTPGRAAALVASSWVGEGFRDAAQERVVRDRAADQVARYVAGLDPAAEPVAIERTVALSTPVLSLSGRVDRLDERAAEAADERGDEAADERGDPRAKDQVVGAASSRRTDDPGPPASELVVVDYKTGRRASTPSAAGSSLALAVYAAAVTRTFRRRCRRVELHHLPTGTVAAFDHTEQSLTDHLDHADALGAELRDASARWAGGLSGRGVDEVFPPRPGPDCAWCDFRVSCRAGTAASIRLPPWAGLDDGDLQPDAGRQPGRTDVG